MRTATITFHAPNNNGSFLQAYALQKFLNTHFPDVENDIIDFQSEAQSQQYAIFRKIHSKKDIIRNVISVGHYSALSKRTKTFSRMREQYLQMTRRCTTVEEVLDIANKYDLVIAGSDQIWNTAARDFSEVYFLPGISKKSTYAISCGSHLNEVDVDKICNVMMSFENVSVREYNAKMFLEEHSERNIEMVLDPTFLLDKEDYADLYQKERIIKEKYIFLYTINYNDDALKQAVCLSQKLGGKIITPFTGYSAIKASKYGIKVLWDVAPDAFLNLIENAECVCSNSFHGIAFSIIFKKNFYRIGSVDQIGRIKNDDRIDSILNLCGLSDRNYSEDAVNQSCTEIDYTKSGDELKRLRECSIQYIKSILKDRDKDE